MTTSYEMSAADDSPPESDIEFRPIYLPPDSKPHALLIISFSHISIAIVMHISLLNDEKHIKCVVSTITWPFNIVYSYILTQVIISEIQFRESTVFFRTESL